MITEILNNLWIALSTQNEILINIFAIPAGFMENYLLMKLFITFFNINVSNKQKIIYVLLITTAGFITMYIIPNPFNLVLNYIFMIAMAYYILKISPLKSTASVVASVLVFNIVGALILNPYMTILKISGEQLSTIPKYRFLYVITMYTVVAIIIYMIKNRHFKITFLEDIDKKTKFIIFLNFLFGIIMIIVQSVIAVYYIDKLPIIITFLSFISILVYFVLNIYSLTKAFDLNLTKRKLESAKEYNNTLHILHDNVRGFKHDFDNIVTTIGGYIKTEDIEGLKKYYSQLEDDCEKVNNLYILNPDIIKNDGIYNLLTKKYYEAEFKNIKVNITFLLDLSILNMKIYEFARILGILLDNAIEASSACEEKVINLIFKNDQKNHRQLIIIENTFINHDIDTEKIFEKGISEKENHTGLGLWEVRKLVKKNNNINLFTSKNKKYFIQQLEIYEN